MPGPPTVTATRRDSSCTHRASDEALRTTVEFLSRLDTVRRVLGVMRVEGEAGGVAMAQPVRGLIEEYRDRLPVTAQTPVVTLREGGTPLVYACTLSEMLGCEVAEVRRRQPDRLLPRTAA